MTDVTAQAFRQAAEEYAYLRDGNLTALLVAAAKQREQLEAERLVVDVITKQQQEQITALTAERDFLTKANARLLALVTAQRPA